MVIVWLLYGYCVVQAGKHYTNSFGTIICKAPFIQLT